MRILFLSDNFPPEVNAPATRTYEHVKEWVKIGHDVTVITCFPNFPQGKIYEGYKNFFYKKESVDGIKVIRVWSYIAENKGFVKRTIDYISYSITAFIIGLFIKTDIIIATSPQFFTALSGRALSSFKNIPWIMEVRDIWPESIRVVGAMKENFILRYFEWQEKRCYRSAKKIVVVTDSFKKNLMSKSVDPNKIIVIKNGVDRKLFAPKEKNERILSDLGLKEKKIVAYIGTHGLAHKLDFILQCASELRNNSNWHFLFIGSGAEKHNLLQLKNKLSLDNVTFIDPVSKNMVSDYISIIDVALINLKKADLFKTVLPSKIFENACMEKPILLGVEGEAKDLIEFYGAGLCFNPEDSVDFCNKLGSLLNNQELYNNCVGGCRKLANDFDRIALADRMIDEIEHSL